MPTIATLDLIQVRMRFGEIHNLVQLDTAKAGDIPMRIDNFGSYQAARLAPIS